MNIYIDESGDLGFKFDKPFERGGSSRYLTIAFLFVPKNLSNRPERIINKINKDRSRSTELKGSKLGINAKKSFAKRTVNMLDGEPEIRISAMTISKPEIPCHIQKKPNHLYNHIIEEHLSTKLDGYDKITIMPDIRSVKTGIRFSLEDQLQTELWFKRGLKMEITCEPKESARELNIRFVDYIANIVWNKYEKNKSAGAYNILQNRMEDIFYKSVAHL